MSDNTSFNILNNHLEHSKNDISEVEHEEPAEDDEVINQNIKAYFSSSKPNQQPQQITDDYDEMMKKRRAREERLRRAQDYKANPTKKRRSGPWL
jgi:hypothetical protein